jgi:hypothetical protein
MKLPALLPLIVASFGALAQAATINVDFNTATSPTYAGTAVLGGGTWNGVNAAAAALLDSTGTATSVSTNYTSVFDGPDGGNTPLGLANDLLRDYRNANNGTLTLTIGGLTANAAYNLVIYAAGDQVVQGSTFSGSGFTGVSTTGAQRDTFALGVNYSQGTATADGTGTVTITIGANKDGANATNTYAVLNGFQISALPIPEPSAAMLGVLGSAVFFLRRRNG